MAKCLIFSCTDSLDHAYGYVIDVVDESKAANLAISYRDYYGWQFIYRTTPLNPKDPARKWTNIKYHLGEVPF